MILVSDLQKVPYLNRYDPWGGKRLDSSSIATLIKANIAIRHFRWRNRSDAMISLGPLLAIAVLICIDTSNA